MLDLTAPFLFDITNTQKTEKHEQIEKSIPR